MPTLKKKEVKKAPTQWSMWGVFTKTGDLDCVLPSRRTAQRCYGPGLGYRVSKVLVKLVR